MRVIYSVLNTNHYKPREIDDRFSEQVYANFLDNLDHGKRFITAKDREKLARHEHQLDEQFSNATYEFLDDARTIYQSRTAQLRDYTAEVLAKPFDFTKEEYFETDPDKVPFSKNDKEWKERWRQYLKYRVLLGLEDKLESQQKAREKEDTAFTYRSESEWEERVREKELERQEEYFDNLSEMDHMDWLSLYINSLTGVYDPHTQYFPPRDKEDFEIRMTGQLEGIGAQLTEKGDYVTVSKIIVGSACWKQGDLAVGDKILKVAQKEGEPLDVVGMKVRDVVKYIRGPKGTEVTLTVKSLDGSQQDITIIRDVVELEATFAKSLILGEGDQKVGYIRLPQFYVNFYNESNRDCAQDVKTEIEKLHAGGADRIILDLRSNGGGSLQGAIDLAGLFIDKGPVVQVKAPNRAPMVLKDETKGAFDDPLIVMVNNYSASASEIFASAIQDYQRGLILGSKTTFGKGTVQNVLEMDRAVNRTYQDVKPLGALKYTMQKYYRINGGTSQLLGVQPDVLLPDDLSYIEYGEKDRPYALASDTIAPAQYTVWPDTQAYSTAIANAQQRIAANEHFTEVQAYARWLEEQQSKSLVTLNLAQFRAIQEADREVSQRYKNRDKADEALLVTANEADVAEQKESEEKKEIAEKWHRSVERDIYIQEAYRVALDL